jgi:hypothetical protein
MRLIKKNENYGSRMGTGKFNGGCYIMKKYSWIVALLLALSFTVFFSGCGADAAEAPEPPPATYEDYPLGAFNTWGGGAAPGSASQQGWATDGYTWTDGKSMTAKSLGYELEKFQNARNLVIEFEKEGTVAGGLHIIWGGYSSVEADNDALGGWNSTQVVSNTGSALPPFATLKGTTLTVDITTLTKYSTYKSPIAEALRFVIAYYSPDVKSLGIKEVYLQIPTDDAFVPVEDITLADLNGYEKSNFVLASTLSPSTATNQVIIWSIMGWLPNLLTDNWSATTGNNWIKPDSTANIAILKGIIDFIDLPDRKETTLVDTSVYPWVYEDTFVPVVSKDTLYTDDIGTVKVRATVINGAEDDDYVKEFNIPIKALVAHPLKFGATGAGNLKVDTNDDTILAIAYETDNSGYTLTPSATVNYEGVYAYFKVTLAAGKTLKDYIGVKVTIDGSGTDATFKDLMIAASNDEFNQGWLSNYVLLARVNNGYGSVPATNTVFFDVSKVDDTCDGNSVYISIHVRGTTGIYKFTDISLLAPF